jgi:hypothetical protein
MKIRGVPRALGSVIVALLSATPQVHGQAVWRDVYACGASQGHSFVLGGDGWSEDGISQGVIIIRRRGTEFDVVHKDASGGTFSALDDGARLIAREEDRALQLIVVYPTMTVETYLLLPTKSGAIELGWTSNKRFGIADRVSAFSSACLAR